MKIIITGGAGFLGSNLCKKLLENGNEVICIDSLLTGSEKNITELKDNPNFMFVKHDVVEPIDGILKQVQNDNHVDQIYHLASPASPSIKSPKGYHALAFETMQVNTIGTWNLCELAVKLKAKLLFASTSETYGEPLEHPQKESYRGNTSTTGPRAVYDESKRFGETIVSAFVRKKGLDGTIVRIFNTYGPGMQLDDGRAVTEFIRAALNNGTFPIEGDGTGTRSFCFVDDLILGLTAAMTKGDKGEVYNLGNPNEFSILELAEKVKELMHSNSEMNFLPYPEDSPTRRCPDITKAKEKLGWEPKIELEEGLRRTINYFQKRPQRDSNPRPLR